MKKLLSFLLVLTALTSSAQTGVTDIDSVFSGGVYRKFRTYVPPVYTGSVAVPVIFNFHGYSSNAIQQQYYGTFMPIADTANFIVVHPEGGLLFGTQFWNTGIVPSPNDVLFTDQMITFLKQKYNLDEARIYSCGMSNGGIMSYYLACNLPNKIAAIASVTGCMFNPWRNCAPGRAMPVMEIHGTDDDVVPYEEEDDFVGVDSTIKKWRRDNNCNPVPTVYNIANTNTADNTTAVNYRYTGGIDGSSVELFKVTGGSHSWPGAFNIVENTNQDFNASVEIWRFFRQYRLTQFVSTVTVTVTTGLSENSASEAMTLFPNPAGERLTVKGVEGAEITVFTADGKTIPVKLTGSQLSTADLPAGLYFLKVKKEGREKVFKFIKE